MRPKNAETNNIRNLSNGFGIIFCVLICLPIGAFCRVKPSHAWDCSIQQPAPNIQHTNKFDVVFIGKVIDLKVKRKKLEVSINSSVSESIEDYEQIQFKVMTSSKGLKFGDTVFIYRPKRDVAVNETSPRIHLGGIYRVFARKINGLLISRTASPCWMMIQEVDSHNEKEVVVPDGAAKDQLFHESSNRRRTKGRLKSRKCCSTCNALSAYGDEWIILIIITLMFGVRLFRANAD